MEHCIYAAGLVDGEGTITLSPYGEFRYPCVSVSSTTIELLEYLKHHFSGTIISKKVYKEHHKPSFQWSLTWQKAVSFLAQVRPFMKEPRKVARADMILHDYQELTPRNGKYTEDMKEAKREFEILFFKI